MKTLLWFIATVLACLAVFLLNEDKTVSMRYGLSLIPSVLGLAIYVFVRGIAE